MARVSRERLWRPGRDIPFLVLCLAVALSLVRSTRQPSFSFGVAGTDVTVTPTDLTLAVLGALAVGRLLGRGTLPRPARALTATAGGFAAWLLVSSAANGAEALVGAVKLLEIGVLALGAILFVQRRAQLWVLVGVLCAMTVVADAYALPSFADSPRGRYGSFLGLHDFGALGALSLTAGVAVLLAPRRKLVPLAAAAALAGGLAIVMDASLASMLGMWLALAAMLIVALVRRSARPAAVATALALGAAVTAAALPSRSGDLGFVESGPALSAEAAGGWSQRLVFAYIGGRVFLDNPVVGTGWHGTLPPDEWARYRDDARRRFPDQPARYFPRPDDDLVPQQTYDQVLFELGIVGALLFLAAAVIAVRTAARVATRWPAGSSDAAIAFLPVAWAAVLAGVLAGSALFGGSPVAAMFWLTLGAAALVPSLVPPRLPAAAPAQRREPVAAAR